MVRLIVLAALTVGLLLAAPPNFSGTWQFDAAKSKGKSESATLVLNQDAGKIHVQTLSSSNEKDADFTCGTAGKECEIKDKGKPAKISMWFNGADLVMLETLGSGGDEIVERQLELEAGGKSLSVEVKHIVPPGDTETLFFGKSQ